MQVGMIGLGKMGGDTEASFAVGCSTCLAMMRNQFGDHAIRTVDE